MNMMTNEAAELALISAAIQQGLDKQPDRILAVATSRLRNDINLMQVNRDVWKAAIRMPVKSWRQTEGWRFVRTGEIPS